MSSMVIEDRPIECPLCGGMAMVVVALPGHIGGEPEIVSFECRQHSASRQDRVDDDLLRLLADV